jgi:hypothetical protein
MLPLPSKMRTGGASMAPRMVTLTDAAGESAPPAATMIGDLMVMLERMTYVPGGT